MCNSIKHYVSVHEIAKISDQEWLGPLQIGRRTGVLVLDGNNDREWEPQARARASRKNRASNLF